MIIRAGRNRVDNVKQVGDCINRTGNGFAVAVQVSSRRFRACVVHGRADVFFGYSGVGQCRAVGVAQAVKVGSIARVCLGRQEIGASARLSLFVGPDFVDPCRAGRRQVPAEHARRLMLRWHRERAGGRQARCKSIAQCLGHCRPQNLALPNAALYRAGRRRDGGRIPGKVEIANGQLPNLIRAHAGFKREAVKQRPIGAADSTADLTAGGGQDETADLVDIEGATRL